MKIVIIGGTGLIGSKTVERLRKQGCEVIAASPNTGVNTITGEGLEAALAGAEVVIDLANSPSFEDKAAMKFFETSGRNLLAADKAAGVKHHIALSVVGTEAGRRLFPRQARPGRADQGFRHSLHDRSFHAVHGVPGWHRPIGYGRRRRASVAGLCTTHRVR